MSWDIVLSRQAVKDLRKLSQAGFKGKLQELFEVLKTNPYQSPPSFEKLIGDFSGAFSRRINIQHRLAYRIDKDKRAVYIIRM